MLQKQLMNVLHLSRIPRILHPTPHPTKPRRAYSRHANSHYPILMTAGAKMLGGILKEDRKMSQYASFSGDGTRNLALVKGPIRLGLR
jgi:hypothetical protein